MSITSVTVICTPFISQQKSVILIYEDTIRHLQVSQHIHNALRKCDNSLVAKERRGDLNGFIYMARSVPHGQVTISTSKHFHNSNLILNPLILHMDQPAL